MRCFAFKDHQKPTQEKDKTTSESEHEIESIFDHVWCASGAEGLITLFDPEVRIIFFLLFFCEKTEH